jgi:thioredoxin-like negative regulator of GroEL
LLLDSNDIRLLTEVGFLASARADVPRAEAIFGALACVRPDRNFAYVGLAMAYLNAGRADEAAQVLGRGAGLVNAQEAPVLEAVRALALQMAGRAAESQRVLLAAAPTRLASVMQGQCIINEKDI